MTATFVCFAALLAACSDDPSSPAPAIGKLNVTVSTSGDDADTDGYLVIVDRSRQPVRVQANGRASRSTVSRWGATGRPGRGRSELCRRWRFGDRYHLGSGRRCRHGPARHVFGVRQCTRVGGDHGHRPRCEWLHGRRKATGFSTGWAALFPRATRQRSSAGRRPLRTTLQGVAANCDGGDIGPQEFDVVSGGAQTLDFAVVLRAGPATRVRSGLRDRERRDLHGPLGRDGRRSAHQQPRRGYRPAWSPDGTRIAFTSDRDGPRAIYVMNEDGSDVKRLTPLTWASFRPAWSPDGRGSRS
jgi:hypothetical protein